MKLERTTAETLSEHFESVDNHMTYEQALHTICKEQDKRTGKKSEKEI